MLIEFSVTNFKSFNKTQTLSMAAWPRLHKKENAFKAPVVGESLPDLLKVAAIYGPNASGKSNLIKALSAVCRIAMRQPSADLLSLPASPFRFDASNADKPSRFEIHFIASGLRYQLNLGVTEVRIVEERLLSFPKGRETLIYERSHTTAGDEYKFGALEGGSELHKAWRNLTGPQVLFMTQVVANSSEDLLQMRAPLGWLKSGLMTMDNNLETWSTASQRFAHKFPFFASGLSTFLREVDVPITEISFDSNDTGTDPTLNEKDLELFVTDIADWRKSTKTILTHKTTLGEAKFDISEESSGTRNLMGFYMPWVIINKTKGSNRQVSTLVIDELDSSLHPKIVTALIEQHLKAENCAQLIFTTHDTHLMDARLLRRDQFWLTERDSSGATQLRSIHDFKGRESEDIEKRYFEGRYRALPIVRRG